jgi:hypothetical protein
LNSALVGGEWSVSRPGLYTPGERAPGIHWIGGWVDTRAGLDDVEKRKFLYSSREIMRNWYGISAVKALCNYRIGEVNTKLGIMEIDSEDVDWIQL